MITVRRGDDRGATQLDWLDSRHTFSFGEYYDPAHMGFRALRVINEDRVRAGAGFDTHAHRDMEIVTYVLEGAVRHLDSMGNERVISAGEVQRMSAGTGVRHSEYNPSQSASTHFLQIWLLPEQRDLPPSYEQRAFTARGAGGLGLIASHDGRDGSIGIHQDVDLYAAVLASGGRVSHELRPGRHVWAQVTRGAVRLNGLPLRAGDGAAVSDEGSVEMGAGEPAEVLLFDLA